jgi:hypothetical protein
MKRWISRIDADFYHEEREGHEGFLNLKIKILRQKERADMEGILCK